jgi:methionyl-tRNA formyltransferase
MKKLRVVFMGTPEFAVPSLQQIIEAGYDVPAVITAPDKPAGRGMKMQESKIKKKAIQFGLKVLQPEKLRDPHFLDELQMLQADLNVVVAFRMLPEIVWNMPARGTINLHASLLPQYRGAAPINWAIINGEKETGLTTFKLKHEIDTGNILLQKKLSVGEQETAGELYDRMKTEGAGLLVKTLDLLSKNNIDEKEQLFAGNLAEPEVAILKHAPKITAETCEINWSHKATDILNLIRGLSPYPAAFTYLNDKKLKIFEAMEIKNVSKTEEGNFSTDQKTYLYFGCGNENISVTDLQLEGKKRMKIADFLRGWRP